MLVSGSHRLSRGGSERVAPNQGEPAAQGLGQPGVGEGRRDGLQTVLGDGGEPSHPVPRSPGRQAGRRPESRSSSCRIATGADRTPPAADKGLPTHRSVCNTGSTSRLNHPRSGTFRPGTIRAGTRRCRRRRRPGANRSGRRPRRCRRATGWCRPTACWGDSRIARPVAGRPETGGARHRSRPRTPGRGPRPRCLPGPASPARSRVPCYRDGPRTTQTARRPVGSRSKSAYRRGASGVIGRGSAPASRR